MNDGPATHPMDDRVPSLASGGEIPAVFQCMTLADWQNMTNSKRERGTGRIVMPWLTPRVNFQLPLVSFLLPLAMALLIAGCGGESPAPKPTVRESVGSDAKPKPTRPQQPPRRESAEPHRGVVDTALNSEPVVEVKTPSKLYRPHNPHRNLDQEQLRTQGLDFREAPGLRLVSDLPSETQQPLVSLFPKLVESLTEYFGPLPEAKDGSRFLMTGYVMSDRDLFTNAGLLQNGMLLQYHGRSIGAEFWMNNQSLDYFRAHLFAHEVTHVFMRHIPGEARSLPFWYLEGMAELFGTHLRSDDGKWTFCVMPRDRSAFRGWERIELLRRDAAGRGMRSIQEISKLSGEDFFRVESYAWSWALCRFLESHPRYRDRFRNLARDLARRPFSESFQSAYATDSAELEAEWMLFANSIDFGFDFERAAVEFRPGKPLSQKSTVKVLSSKGWQPTGISLEANQTYRITATGQVTLASRPKAWVSEANGVSIRYVRGQPLGRLLGCLRFSGASELAARSMLTEYPLGNTTEITPALPGTLFLRLNDALSELEDNTGEIVVAIEAKD